MADAVQRRSPWLEVTFAMVAVLGAALLAWSIRKEKSPPLPVQPAQTVPYGLEPGPYPVHHLENVSLALADQAGSLSLRVSYPQGEGTHPVIVFLPGPRQYQGVMDWLVDHWVSNGYVVIQHFLGDPPAPSSVPPPGAMADPPEDYQLQQLAQVSFMVDQVPQVIARIPLSQGMADVQRIALAGMGLAGNLPLLLGGATAHAMDPEFATAPDAAADAAKPPEAASRKFSNPRVGAVISLWSLFAPSRWTLREQSLETLAVPVLLVSNPWDPHPQTRELGWRRGMFDHAPPGGSYLLSMTSALPLPLSESAVEDSDDRAARRYQRMTEQLRMSTTAFLDAYLKENDVALYFLRSDAIEEQSRMRTRFDKK